MTKKLLSALRSVAIASMAAIGFAQNASVAAQAGEKSDVAVKTAAINADELADAQVRFYEERTHLTDEQKTAIRTLSKNFSEQTSDVTARNQEKTRATLEAIRAAQASGNSQQLIAAQSAMNALNAPISEAAIKYSKDLAAILTPQQKKEFDESSQRLLVAYMIAPLNIDSDKGRWLKARYAELMKRDSKTAIEKLRADLTQKLSPEEKASIMRYHAKNSYKKLLEMSHATPEELKKLDSITDEVIAATDFDKDWPEFAGLAVKLMPRVNDVLLSKQKDSSNRVIFGTFHIDSFHKAGEQ